MKMNIDELSVLDYNPRQISPFMMGKLIESILVFPAMLDLRPIVKNGEAQSIGGNQRLTALRRIKDMTKDEIEAALQQQRKYRDKTDEEKQALIDYWLEWQKKPEVEVRDASELTEEEQKEFLAKDNLHYGEDDQNMLIHNFDLSLIEDYTGEIIIAHNDNVDYSRSDGDDTQQQGGGDETPEDIILSCGIIAMKLNQDEFNRLSASLEEYKTDKGSTDGFINFLLL